MEKIGEDAFKRLGIDAKYGVILHRARNEYTMWIRPTCPESGCAVLHDNEVELISMNDIDLYAASHGYTFPTYLAETNIIGQRAFLVADIVQEYLDDGEYVMALECGRPLFQHGKLIYQHNDTTPEEYGGNLHQIYQFGKFYVYISNVYGSCEGCFRDHNVLLKRVSKCYVSHSFAHIYDYMLITRSSDD